MTFHHIPLEEAGSQLCTVWAIEVRPVGGLPLGASPVHSPLMLACTLEHCWLVLGPPLQSTTMEWKHSRQTSVG